MKFLIQFLLFLFLAVSLLCKSTYAQSNLSDGLIAYYPFNGNALDESGNGNNGAVYGATLATDRFGNCNSAYYFNGVSNYIEIPHSEDLNIQQSLTLAAWVRSESPINPETYIIAKGDQVPYSLMVKQGYYALNVGYNRLTSYALPTSFTARENNWHFVVGTYDGTNAKVYIDGVLENTVPYTEILLSDAGPIQIGHRPTSRNYSVLFFKGAIDDIRIYDYAISGQEMLDLYTEQVPSNDCLIAYYPFNGSGNDESGNGNDGLPEGGLLYGQGACGNASLFDGVDDYIRVPHSGTLDLGYSSFTLISWIKSEHYINLPFEIVEKMDRDAIHGTIKPGFFFRITSGGIADATISDGTHVSEVMGETNVIDNQWHQLVVLFDKSSGIKVYIDGEPETVTNIEAPIQSVGNINVVKDLYIGQRIDNTYKFKGFIDEVKIYKRLLTEAEITESYNECAMKFGNISGVVSVSSVGLQSVLVKLLDEFGMPVDSFDDHETDTNGQYSFVDVPVGNYQVMIVEPLGYMIDQNPKFTSVVANETSNVNFDLTEVVIVNSARGKGYWKHQFDVYVTNKGNAQETAQDLLNYINLVHQHYTIHFNIYTSFATFTEWQNILSLKGNQPMVEKAKQHLAALIMNMVSNKVGQYTVVTMDGRDVGDVIQYISELILDGVTSNDELAKDLAESVSNQQMISSGLVPEGTILFKPGNERSEALTYSLFDNYPNPFNPTTTIKYQIPESGLVTLLIYDVLGNEVAELINENKEPGSYIVEFNASDFASGVYIYKLLVNDFISSKKMILIK